jgi:hypothetical protein
MSPRASCDVDQCNGNGGFRPRPTTGAGSRSLLSGIPTPVRTGG